jgi:hypothetical protein
VAPADIRHVELETINFKSPSSEPPGGVTGSRLVTPPMTTLASSSQKPRPVFKTTPRGQDLHEGNNPCLPDSRLSDLRHAAVDEQLDPINEARRVRR